MTGVSINVAVRGSLQSRPKLSQSLENVALPGSLQSLSFGSDSLQPGFGECGLACRLAVLDLRTFVQSAWRMWPCLAACNP